MSFRTPSCSRRATYSFRAAVTASFCVDQEQIPRMPEKGCEKATSPFFSAKPAGRKRGMGLAYASRLIRLNRGTLEIAGQAEHGTTVTVTLPYE
jgi:signal transduction histidine kinase